MLPVYVITTVVIVIAVLSFSLAPAVHGHQGQKVLVAAELNKPALAALIIAFVMLLVGVPGLFILFLFAALLCSFA